MSCRLRETLSCALPTQTTFRRSQAVKKPVLTFRKYYSVYRVIALALVVCPAIFGTYSPLVTKSGTNTQCLSVSQASLRMGRTLLCPRCMGLSLSLSLLWTSYGSNAQSAASDKALLLQAGWADQVNWSVATDMCSWTGVTCSMDRVIKM